MKSNEISNSTNRSTWWTLKLSSNHASWNLVSQSSGRKDSHLPGKETNALRAARHRMLSLHQHRRIASERRLVSSSGTSQSESSASPSLSSLCWPEAFSRHKPHSGQLSRLQAGTRPRWFQRWLWTNDAIRYVRMMWISCIYGVIMIRYAC